MWYYTIRQLTSRIDHVTGPSSQSLAVCHITNPAGQSHDEIWSSISYNMSGSMQYLIIFKFSFLHNIRLIHSFVSIFSPGQSNIQHFRHFTGEPKKQTNKQPTGVCGTYDFLGEPWKFMCTYNIFFFKFCQSYSFFLEQFFNEKVQKMMQFQICCRNYSQQKWRLK